jgi:hypothetical protein
MEMMITVSIKAKDCRGLSALELSCKVKLFLFSKMPVMNQEIILEMPDVLKTSANSK